MDKWHRRERLKAGCRAAEGVRPEGGNQGKLPICERPNQVWRLGSVSEP